MLATGHSLRRRGDEAKRSPSLASTEDARRELRADAPKHQNPPRRPPNAEQRMARALGPDDLNDSIRDHLSQELTTVRSDQTVGAALESLRGQKLAERIVYFYVVDAENRLVGVLPTRRLLMSSP